MQDPDGFQQARNVWRPLISGSPMVWDPDLVWPMNNSQTIEYPALLQISGVKLIAELVEGYGIGFSFSARLLDTKINRGWAQDHY